jgi:hypothetical protein
MILSSADILRILGGSEIIRLSAKLKIVDGQPPLSGAEGLFIFIDRFPFTDEFQATWTIYIESDGSEPDDLVITEIKKLLPGVKIKPGLMTTVTTTDFLSDSTQKASETPNPIQAKVDLTQYERRFQELVEGVQDQMLLVSSGRPGRDGANGKDGTDGLDGKDLKATETSLFDLSDVVQSRLPFTKGQVLMFDGVDWTNLYAPQISTIFGGGGSGDGENVIISDTPPAARDDGSPLQEGDQWWKSDTGTMYIWYVDETSSQWVQSSGSGGGGASELNDLIDVTIDPTLLDADFGLVYDGTEWVVASPPVLVEGHNQTGSTIVKGTPVYVAGTHSSGKPLFGLADANGSGNAPAIGLLHEDMVDGIDGHVMLSGVLGHIDTSAYSAGDALYLSTTPGVLTSVRPTAATEKVQKVGIVTRSHATAGSILIIGAGRTNDITNELVALIGAGDRDAVDLGVFSGNIIGDNTDIKTALGELEVAVDESIPEAPQDGNYYVRQNGAWINLSAALFALNDQIIDGGNLTTGSSTGDDEIIDGGNFT